MVRYSSIDIVLQEIPDEISLCINITGCNLRCDGCHSPYLWKEGSGNELSNDVLKEYIIKYKDIISCVLFMGGEWCDDLINKIIICKEYGIKTALYTGLDLEEMEINNSEILNNLDYIKVGRWIKELGGLDKENTNQKLINLKNKSFVKIKR